MATSFRIRETLLTPRDRRTVLAALREAADRGRELAAACPSCGPAGAPPCGDCEDRAEAASAYEALAIRLSSTG